MSTDAFLKSVKKFLDKEVRIIPFNSHSRSHHTTAQSFVMFCFTMLGYIFGIDCQTTLQVQEKFISRSPVEMYVQLRCTCCVRILGQLSGYWATQELCKNINFAMETKAKKLKCLSSYQRLNRFSLGQISELLRLTKKSYSNVKMKCPDTGQHTVTVVQR